MQELRLNEPMVRETCSRTGDGADALDRFSAV